MTTIMALVQGPGGGEARQGALAALHLVRVVMLTL